MSWIKITETDKPKPGLAVRIFHEAWIGDDFNPTGTADGFLLDDGHDTWWGAFWNDEQDCWDTLTCKPTHYCEHTGPGDTNVAIET